MGHIIYIYIYIYMYIYIPHMVHLQLTLYLLCLYLAHGINRTLSGMDTHRVYSDGHFFTIYLIPCLKLQCHKDEAGHEGGSMSYQS